MCVLAGYVGEKSAAPILLELLEKQEGLAGGYYTGVATVHQGELHYRKVVGDVAKLRRTTDAESLPGEIGIAHSRTPSGGDVEWGHPFVDCTGSMAYVAQGAMGFFEGRTDMKAAGNDLLARGHVFRARSKEKVGAYPVLSDGCCVHISDIHCHAVEEALGDCGSRLEAMRRAYMSWPAEIVGMTVHRSDSEHIIAACINQPLVIARDASGTYLASTGLALPASVQWRMPMPPNAAAAVWGSGMEIRPFDLSSEPVDCNCPCAEAEAKIILTLKDKPGCTWGTGYHSTQSLWPKGSLTRNTAMAYEILERLYHAGRLRFETVHVPGMFGEGTAPQVRMHLTAGSP